jgi:6 kDa early secretory antigenic target
MDVGAMRVNFGAMDSGASQIDGSARSINQQLDDLKRFLQPLVATWTGEASQAYQAKQAQWDAAAADLNRILAQVGSAVHAANLDYQSTERTNTQAWS